MICNASKCGAIARNATDSKQQDLQGVIGVGAHSNASTREVALLDKIVNVSHGAGQNRRCFFGADSLRIAVKSVLHLESLRVEVR